MAFEISVISAGAILILLVLMAWIFTPGQRGGSENNMNHSGMCLQAVHFCWDEPAFPNSSASPLCF